MLALVLLAASLAGAQVCLNNTGYVTSNPAALCVYCNLMGTLSHGACNCTSTGLSPTCAAIQPPVAGMVNSTCGYGECHDDDGRCVVSTGPGARCQECLVAGWINGTTCACYNKGADPSAFCQLLVNTQTSVTVMENVTTASCDWWNSTLLGHYSGAFTCLLPTLGPVPNQDLLPYECNTYGGPDPLNPDGFLTCNGHGTWNATSYSCVCDQGWALAPIGVGVNNTVAMSCTVCALWYGPPVPAPAACGVVWAPNRLTGIFGECSLEGTYLNGVCSCVQNPTQGFWALETLPNSTAQTCTGCLYGYTEASNCTVALSTQAPTPGPSMAPTPPQSPQLYMAVLESDDTWPPIGLIGNRSATNERCLSAFSGCTRAFALMCYAGDAMRDMPANYSFSASADIIYLNTTGSDSLASVVGSFTEYINGTGLILAYVGSSLDNVGADVFAFCSYGCFTNATAVPLADSCQDYTTTSGVLMSPYGDLFGCGVTAGLVCLCTESDMTPPPVIVHSPTASPTP